MMLSEIMLMDGIVEKKVAILLFSQIEVLAERLVERQQEP